ncbi:MAG: histidine--tRNA ligase family protein, partial [Cyclobacteriaceae bacterium]|nr:histidine--tRNA ligase family protein [Cyclobacteriaceae bacterium]
CESEIILMINEVMLNLGLADFTTKINNRKLLTAITDLVGEHGKEAIFCVAIDKLDKIGRVKVEEELSNNGFSTGAIKKLDPVFNMKGSNEEIIHQLEGLLYNSEIGKEGIDELKQVFGFLNDFGFDEQNVKLDLTLARGLSYYTGIILEVIANNSSIRSSITGGGRYDNLTGVFGLEGVSGVGFSFGVDRIYDVMDDLDLFPKEYEASTKVLLLNFGSVSFKESLKVLTRLRAANVKSEVYPDAVKIKKQMNYANKKGVPFVLIIGEDELKEGKFQLKDMNTGNQQKLEIQEIIDYLS